MYKGLKIARNYFWLYSPNNQNTARNKIQPEIISGYFKALTFNSLEYLVKNTARNKNRITNTAKNKPPPKGGISGCILAGSGTSAKRAGVQHG